MHLAHQPEILIAEVGRLEVPTQVICRLHQISLTRGGRGGACCEPVMGGPRGPTVQRGTPSWTCVVEWHGYVLRPRAVTVGSGEDAAAPNVGLEVVTISVVGHGTRHIIEIGRAHV